MMGNRDNVSKKKKLNLVVISKFRLHRLLEGLIYSSISSLRYDKNNNIYLIDRNIVHAFNYVTNTLSSFVIGNLGGQNIEIVDYLISPNGNIYMLIRYRNENTTEIIKCFSGGRVLNKFNIPYNANLILVDNAENLIIFENVCIKEESEKVRFTMHKYNQNNVNYYSKTLVINLESEKIKAESIKIGEYKLYGFIDKSDNIFIWFYAPFYKILKLNSQGNLEMEFRNEKYLKDSFIRKMKDKYCIPIISDVFMEPLNRLIFVKKNCEPTGFYDLDVWNEKGDLEEILVKDTIGVLGSIIWSRQKMWFDQQANLDILSIKRLFSKDAEITKCKLDLNDLEIL